MRQLFATRIEELAIGDAALREGLARCAWLMEEEDEAGNAWCDAEGYPGYTSYASLDDLPERFPEFAELKRHLDKAAAAFAKAQHWDMEGFALSLDAIWVNILGEGGHHSGHIHPGSVISGTYYVAVPEGAGRIKFEDPRLAMMMAAPQLVENAPEAARRFVYITPQEGHCLLWESWLRHEVMPSASEDARISVSFNYGLKRK
ncbi:TIGR02466 family protein [Hyphomonas sp.]|uniref:TIGR02466 family protein n=1 Tax=Hyphomonas sp. TaxID=87 RepID=UPI00391902D0